MKGKLFGVFALIVLACSGCAMRVGPSGQVFLCADVGAAAEGAAEAKKLGFKGSMLKIGAAVRDAASDRWRCGVR